MTTPPDRTRPDDPPGRLSGSRWLIDIAARHRGHVLDVGCGEGLLVQRLAGGLAQRCGVDSDPESVRRARVRLQSIDNASVELARFEDFDADERSFDVITFVPS